MKLFMSGRQFKAAKEPPRVVKAKAFLNASKDGELFGTEQLAAAIGLSAELLRANNALFTDYFHLHKNKKYWGKPATIRQLIKETSK